MRRKPKIDTAAANRAIRFFENLKLSTGQWAGQRVKLMPWQKEELVVPAFGTLLPDGRRQYRTVYLEIPRKNAKTESGAMFGCYLLFGDDEAGAQVYSAAGDQEQAGLIYNAAAPMIRQNKSLLRRAKILENRKRIVYRAANSFWQVLSAEAYSKHGLNAHGILFDELHVQPTRELWDVLTTSTGTRRQPMILVMTTAGFDRNSIAWEIHDYALKVKKGLVDDPTFLPIIYAAEDDADWTDEKVWRRCNPAIDCGVRSIEEMRTLCNRARETPALEMTFRRLYLNQWVNSVQRWMPIEKWDACHGAVNLDELKGRPAYAGIDLASTTDLAGISLLFPMGDRRYKWLPFAWIPEDTAAERERREHIPYSAWIKQGLVKATPGNVIDYDFIIEECKKLAAIYDIREWAYDRWNADMFVQTMEKDGAKMVPVGLGYASMNAPTKELMTLVLQGKIEHGGHPVLRTHADNLVVRTDPAGNLKPDKEKATQKIDLMVAGILALSRAMLLEDGKSVYESRGVLSF